MDLRSPSEMDTLFQIYQKNTKEFKKEVNFQSYLEILGLIADRSESPMKLWEDEEMVKIPLFNGGKKVMATTWLQKLETFFTLSPMMEEEAMQFTTLHLDGTTYEWWHHGLITQHHNSIHTFDKFSQRILDFFDLRDEDEYFWDLASVKQKGSIDAYIAEFQQKVVMVPNISQKRMTSLFEEGLLEPLKCLVKAFSPITLQEAIKRALALEHSMEGSRFAIPFRSKETKPLLDSRSCSKKSSPQASQVSHQAKKIKEDLGRLDLEEKGFRESDLRHKPTLSRLEAQP